MKIALVGEFSSLHKYLKEGLLALGHEAVLASSGDGYKQIGGQDIMLPVIRNPFNVMERANYHFTTGQIVRGIAGFDVVQLIHTNVFSPLINTYAVKKLKGSNGLLSLEAAGSDYAFLRAYESGEYEYHPYNFYRPSSYDKKTVKGRAAIKTALFVETSADIIIPAMYDYTLGYRTEKLYDIVPLPINVDSISYQDNRVKGKLVFFHGLNKEKEKGTKLIIEAMKRLKDAYPSDVEIVVDGHMPFNKYVELMKNVNVLIDQTYGYAYGINACLGLAQGKVVVTSCKDTAIRKMSADFNPFVSIKPEVDDIYDKLCYVVENRWDITDMGSRGRSFVKKYHDHLLIAQKYVNAWNSAGR